MNETETKKLIETLRRQQALSNELRQSHLRLQAAVAGGPVRVAWHRERRHYYLRAACLAVLLAAALDACCPVPNSAVVRISHDMTREQAIGETIDLLAAGEKA